MAFHTTYGRDTPNEIMAVLGDMTLEAQLVLDDHVLLQQLQNFQDNVYQVNRAIAIAGIAVFALMARKTIPATTMELPEIAETAAHLTGTIMQFAGEGTPFITEAINTRLQQHEEEPQQHAGEVNNTAIIDDWTCAVL